MKNFLTKLGAFEERILTGGLWTLLFLVFLQVVLRYFWGVTWNWVEEVCRFLFLWMVWIGAGYATKCRAHLKIEAFLSLFPSKFRSGVDLAALLRWIVFAVFLAWTGSKLTWNLIRRYQVSPVLQIPMALAYASVPVGVSLMVLHLLENLANLLRAPRADREDA
jgi:C4-dicarboxylate transporter DctQ subunit